MLHLKVKGTQTTRELSDEEVRSDEIKSLGAELGKAIKDYAEPRRRSFENVADARDLEELKKRLAVLEVMLHNLLFTPDWLDNKTRDTLQERLFPTKPTTSQGL